MPFIGKQSTSNSQITNYTTTVGSGGQSNFTVVIEGGDETHVYLNGVLLKETTDYTVSSTQVSLVSPAVENDIVEIKVFRSFALVDAVRASEGGTFSGNIGIGGSPDELLHLKSSTSLKPVLKIENTNDNHLNAQIHLVKSTTYESNDDYLGQVDFKGMDSDGNLTTYGRIQSQAKDVANGSEDGRVFIGSMKNGTLDETLNVVSGKIGIGDSSPNEKLVVSDNTASEFASVIKNTHASGAGMKVFGATGTQYSFIVRDYTDTSNNLIVLGNGNVEIGTGNLVIGNAGQGITFQGAGGTGTSVSGNTLDDYEFGTFTATCAHGVTLHSSLNQCKYTKIGEQVTVRGQVRVDSDNGNSVFQINNLPFTSKSVGAENDNYAIGAVRTYQWELDASDLWVIAEIDANSSILGFLTCRDNAAAVSLPADSNAYIMFTISYTAI